MERRVEARLAALQQAMVPPPPPPPSFDEDPARHLKAQLDALNEQQRFLTQQTEESRRAQAQAEQINQPQPGSPPQKRSSSERPRIIKTRSDILPNCGFASFKRWGG